MNKILHATSRGQITLPKEWRDKFKVEYYEARVEVDKIVITPLRKVDGLQEKIETAWEEYKNGEVIDGGAMMKKYGL
ncbi:MAG TPA: AbrB/MazE/SpoVT family DNA-binding domain-containing protein [Candidatus Gracilibacteria bacterium]|nr:AbrB/MazE/SpoVT family DNA-binding domain-containing protein [Candidatus Gracilibacteria bacterium]